MNFKSLNKRIIGDKLRMTEPSVLFSSLSPSEYTLHLVKGDEIGLPSLIANRYKSENLTDQLLKINRISNPFSINEGEILIVPSNLGENLIQWKTIDTTSTTDNPIRQQFLKNKKQQVVDKRRQDFLNRKTKNKKNQVEEFLPPNILGTGETNSQNENGNLTF